MGGVAMPERLSTLDASFLYLEKPHLHMDLVGILFDLEPEPRAVEPEEPNGVPTWPSPIDLVRDALVDRIREPLDAVRRTITTAARSPGELLRRGATLAQGAAELLRRGFAPSSPINVEVGATRRFATT